MTAPTLHVLLKKEDLDPSRAAGKTVVVIDTLFATTSIVTALAEGVEAVLPALDDADARALAQAHGEPARLVLAGEYHSRPPPGFRPATPLALRQSGLADRLLIYTTTNGTVALRKASSAYRVFAACLRNARATAEHIAHTFDGRTLLILCAGSGGHFNLEDFYTAGRLVERLVACRPFALTDAARVAAGYAAERPADVLFESRVARHHSMADGKEVEFSSEIDCVDVVAQLVGDRIMRIDNGGTRAQRAAEPPGPSLPTEVQI